MALNGNYSPLPRVRVFGQKHITLKRLNYAYLFRIMLRIFSRRSRPIRSTEMFLPK